MQPSVLCPTAYGLEEIGIIRTPGPPDWSMDSLERCDRIRSALTNFGFALPSGTIRTVMSIDSEGLYAYDLAVALAVLLSDRANEHLQRDGWIAWGALRLDGALAPSEEPIINDMGPIPSVGRVWDPTDHIPQPHEDAVISVCSVADLEQAWDALTAWIGIEEMLHARDH